MDLVSDLDNLDKTIGSKNPIENELANAIEGSVNHYDPPYKSHPRGSSSQEIELRGNSIFGQDRFLETMETFTYEIKLRLYQEMDSMMFMMHSQTNRAIGSAITERKVLEIQILASSFSSVWFVRTIRNLLTKQLGLNLKLQKRTVGAPLIWQTQRTLFLPLIRCFSGPRLSQFKLSISQKFVPITIRLVFGQCAVLVIHCNLSIPLELPTSGCWILRGSFAYWLRFVGWNSTCSNLLGW